MNSNLTTGFEECFEYDDTVFHLDMAFDNVLKVFELFDDDSFDVEEKFFIFFEMMIKNYKDLEHKQINELVALYKFILTEFIGTAEESDDKGPSIMNFQKDSGLIYASFLAEYDMDLYEQVGKLHWQKFRELLTNLGDKTPFKKAIGYRTMKLPTSDKASQEYIDYVRKMKEVYSLEDEQQKQEGIENTFNSAFNSMKAKALAKKGG